MTVCMADFQRKSSCTDAECLFWFVAYGAVKLLSHKGMMVKCQGSCALVRVSTAKIDERFWLGLMHLIPNMDADLVLALVTAV